MKKIAWMFNENEKYQKLNQLAIESDRIDATKQPKMLIAEAKTVDDIKPNKVRTVPQLQLCQHEAQSSLFFKKPGEDMARA